jgi:hypothetical protein
MAAGKPAANGGKVAALAAGSFVVPHFCLQLPRRARRPLGAAETSALQLGEMSMMFERTTPAGRGGPLLLLLAAWLTCAGSVRAYDLSRAYDSDAAEVENGFVVGSVGLWVPGFGRFHDFHTLSLEYAGEVGIRFASIRGHNLYGVGGFNFSPQKLSRDEVPDASRRSTKMLLGYAGVRYLPGPLCFGDGLGCPFVELRFGLLFEDADAHVHPDAPSAQFTVLPGFGYRFAFGRVFQLGARLDFSWAEEDHSRDLGWLTVTGFLGIGW